MIIFQKLSTTGSILPCHSRPLKNYFFFLGNTFSHLPSISYIGADHPDETQTTNPDLLGYLEDFNMKKTTSLLLAGVLTCSTLVACSSGDTDVNTVPAETPVPQVTIEDLAAPFAELEMALQMPGMMAGTDAELEALYGLDADLFESYVIKVPMMNVTATEYAVFELKSADDMDTLTDAILARVESLEATWSTYLPEQYALVEDFTLLKKNNFALFSIGEHNDYFENTFRRLFDESIEALTLPVLLNQVSGEVVEQLENGLVIDVFYLGATYRVTGFLSEMTYVEGDMPQVGDLVDVSFETAIDGNSDDLTGTLTFVGITPDYNAEADSDDGISLLG